MYHASVFHLEHGWQEVGTFRTRSDARKAAKVAFCGDGIHANGITKARVLWVSGGEVREIHVWNPEG